MSLVDTPLPSMLSGYVKEHKAVLFLGAGASYGARHPCNERIPSGEHLRNALSDQFFAGALKSNPLAAVAEYAVNETSLVDVQQFIRDVFSKFEPADFHLILPNFRWHAIVTTNYDLILETKTTSNGLQYVKLHGCVDHYLDTDIPFVLAVEQYVRFAKHRTRLFERIRDWGAEFPIIFCGYSLSDPNIQEILFDLSALGPNRPMYYFIDPGIEPVEERYWAKWHITPIKITFEQFLRALDADKTKVCDEPPRTEIDKVRPVDSSAGQTLPLYHRIQSPTQTPMDAQEQQISGKIWGRAAKYSAFPAVRAYRGALPSDHQGIEFTTSVKPTPGAGTPFEARWYRGSHGVHDEGVGFVWIPAKVTKNTQGRPKRA